MTDTIIYTQTTAEAPLATVIKSRILAIAAMTHATLREWRHNFRSRRELAMLSEFERYDLNFSGDVDAEIAKPFWKK
jgi:uncharacterized protein YjiS (DUF1127 family)